MKSINTAVDNDETLFKINNHEDNDEALFRIA